MLSSLHLFFLAILTLFFLCGILLFLAYFVSFTKYDFEKVSAYECGFAPFMDARKKMDIRFYLIAILFIIFDLELAFFFPWSLNISFLSYEGFYSMLFFYFILLVGFLLEALKGALDWE